MKPFLIAPLLTLAVAACGGEGGPGTPADGASAKSAAAGQPPILLADASRYGTMVDAQAAGPVLPAPFAPVVLAGARGDEGLYWLRQYTVG